MNTLNVNASYNITFVDKETSKVFPLKQQKEIFKKLQEGDCVISMNDKIVQKLPSFEVVCKFELEAAYSDYTFEVEKQDSFFVETDEKLESIRFYLDDSDYDLTPTGEKIKTDNGTITKLTKQGALMEDGTYEDLADFDGDVIDTIYDILEPFL